MSLGISDIAGGREVPANRNQIFIHMLWKTRMLTFITHDQGASDTDGYDGRKRHLEVSTCIYASDLMDT
jgi:hypothetical protein